MKSIYNKLAEALDALDKAGKRKQFNEKVQPQMTTESRLNLAESILGEKIADKFGDVKKESTNPLQLVDIEEAKRDHAILFGLEPKTTTKEGAAHIKKNNGAAANFVEGSPFNGDRSKAPITETNKSKEHVGKSGKSGDQILRESLGIPEVKPSSEYDNLTEAQKREFNFARLIGISEADSFKLVKITGGYKQVSRR